LEMIEDDHFGFGAERLAYEGKAEGSWKHQALGQAYFHWLGACQARVAAHVGSHGDGLFDRFLAFSGKQIQSLLDKSSAAADAFGRDIAIDCGSPAAFLKSDYRKFHDAAKEQRNLVLAELLPRAGIWAA